MYAHKHLIIGAGPCGLAAAKAFKEANIAYDQVEASDNVGGNWYHGVYKTAHIISSKKITQYPDYPMPDDYPDFPSAQNMFDYYTDYANHFDIRRFIEFNTLVTYVRPVENNLWEVTLNNNQKRTYKGVLVCNGHHWDRRWPQLPGTFTGELIHSKDYKHPDQLKDKRVLVIGGGNSACDVVSEAARVSTRAVLSLRSGVWFLPKTLLGVPLADIAKPWAPVWLQRLILRGALKIITGSYTQYGLPTPDHRIFDKHPTVSTEVLQYIKHGRIKPRPAIQAIHDKTITFTDGTQEIVDLIVCATGFHVSYPFLPPELNRVEGPVVKVYGGSMLHDYKGLYLFGWAQVRGGVGSLFTPGLALMARMINLQDQVSIPLGLVLKDMGAKLPTSHIGDPNEVFRRIHKANRFFNFFARKAQAIAAKYTNFQNKPLPPVVQPQSAPTSV
jgi:cation diffusion facilitator CzcD-associated flavoprotein CzcO